MRAWWAISLLVLASPAFAGTACTVWEDVNGDGRFDAGDRPLPGIKVSDGRHVVVTDANGEYRLPVGDDPATHFVVKPAGYDLPARGNGLPDFWRNRNTAPGPALKYGGIPAAPDAPECAGFRLLPAKRPSSGTPLDVLVFTDTQVKNAHDVDYYRRAIVEPLLARRPSAQLGLTLGDVVEDDLSLYPRIDAQTRRLQVPWLHIAGNHDMDLDAARDGDALLTFRNNYGPDSFAWEEDNAVFVGLDDVVYLPGRKPAYVGGLREDQFEFLQAYLPTVPKDRLLVVGLHIPLFDAEPGRETFRHADRARLFALLKDFPHVLVLSGHTHNQQHYFHGAAEGWQGTRPLHEYNVGAICGAFWSGVKDAQGVPDSTMSDGTPIGYATLRVEAGGDYALAWHPAREPGRAIALHAPKVLRQGAYPAWGVYANVFMGDDGTRVEFRVDGGEWQPMKKVLAPDPDLLRENVADDSADALRGYDRSPEATPSRHLWRGALPTKLAEGGHEVEVRAFDRWQGEQRAATRYRLQVATP